LASLDVELPQRGVEYLFSTPRGEVQLTATAVAALMVGAAMPAAMAEKFQPGSAVGVKLVRGDVDMTVEYNGDIFQVIADCSCDNIRYVIPALLGGAPFLPVHWGTFNLAMHTWDQPAETLLELGPKTGAQLVMPRLGF
jgi:hypothetical protein